LEVIEEWIVKNVTEDVVPCDEGNCDALIYNLIHLLRDGEGYQKYQYAQKQDDELAEIYKKYGKKVWWAKR
jgi:hypothetical protein